MSLPAYSHYPDYVVTSPSVYIVVVLINRPSHLNTFTDRMWHHLGSLFAQLSHDNSVRAIILSGCGDNLTAGLDMHEASQGDILNGMQEGVDGARRAVRLMRYIEKFQECVSAVEKCEKPVICVLHGISYGIGIDIASCTDIRLCTTSTRFSVKEVDIGIAADLGTLSRLPRVVGNFGWVKDVCMSARAFSPEEALRVGFVTEVLETKDEAMERAKVIASVLASKAPVAVQGTKEILNHARDHSVVESLRHTAIWNAAALQTRDVGEAVEAWKQKRIPRFQKL